MISKDYREAAVEVLDILNHTDNKLVQKIPSKFIEFLEENCSKEYVSNLDHSKKIKEMDLKPKTEAILGLIYLKYWADEEGKKKFEQKMKENEEFFANELKAGFDKQMFNNSDNIKNEEECIEENTNSLPKEYGNINFITRVINKIRTLFRR